MIMGIISLILVIVGTILYKYAYNNMHCSTFTDCILILGSTITYTGIAGVVCFITINFETIMTWFII